MGRARSGDGSVRQIDNGFECVMQSKYLNPKTMKPKRVKRVGATEEEARRLCKLALRNWEKQYEDGRDEKIDKKRTFGSYMEEYLDTIAKKTLTASGYHSYISCMKNNFFAFDISKMQLHMLSKRVFQDYYDDILSKKSRKTCSIPRQLCVRCCKWLIEQSLMEENFADQAKFDIQIVDEYIHKQAQRERERKEIFTSEDIQKFYDAWKNNFPSEYTYVTLFLLETGLRAGEFATLKLDNVDFEENIIWIRETQAIRFKDNIKDNGVEYYTKVPKNKKERFIVMSDLCREVVEGMIKQTEMKAVKNPEGLLYPVFRSGRARSNSTMEVGFKSLCDKLGIDRDVRLTPTGQKKGLCLHSLRHTYDSIANAAKGANIINTALSMGHSAVRTENIYTHAVKEGLEQITTPSKAIIDDYKKEEEIQQGELTKEEERLLLELLKKKYGN